MQLPGWLYITFRPDPAAREFLAAAQSQERDGVEVRVAVLDSHASRTFFGVHLARRGIQPVWIEIHNRSENAVRLQLVSVDPNYFSPLEAAAANHYSGGKRILQYGAAAWLLFFWVILWLPIKLISVFRANQQMDDFFQEHAFHLRPVSAGESQTGFVFTNLSLGSKTVPVKLLRTQGQLDYEFTLQVPGLAADYLRHEFETLYPVGDVQDVDLAQLRQRLTETAATTTNRHATRHGDPVNLVVIGDFPTVLSAFCSRWDETEVISLASCWKTARAFLIGSEYRYSPVSALYLLGRSQDLALQRIRKSINERVHLRLWIAPWRFRGQSVWIGQVSRDIGVRFTWKTWNLTTHRVDPDVDEARDYVVEDLMQIGRLKWAGYVSGAPTSDRKNPGRNLTGDPYYSDGKRAVVFVSPTLTTPKFVAME